jgi:hypothetical protein
MANPLFFRRQFLLGDRPLPIENWQHHTLRKEWVITAHPDLNVLTHKTQTASVTLLGYMLDAENPLQIDEVILRNLPIETTDIDVLVRSTRYLSGRWLLICLNKSFSVIITDAGSCRDIYFTRHKDITWCGSQPHLLDKYLDIPLWDNEQITGYFELENLKANNYKWTTNYSPYKDVYRLQPNQYLDLQTAKSCRYSPGIPSELLPLHRVTDENCRILSNTILAASRRYELMLACTAGYDSRVQLAASRSIARDLYFYVFQYQRMADEHPDIRVPQSMFSELGIPFHIIAETDIPDDDFVSAFAQNTLIHRYPVLPVIYHQYKHFPDTLNVSENILSIIKVAYQRAASFDAREFATLCHQPHHEFILDWLSDWISSVRQSFPMDRVNLTDIYYWEVHLSNLVGTGATEQDIALEELSPSNNRAFLQNCFSVHPDYHTEPQSYAFHDKMINHMWKELLSYPINPDRMSRLTDMLRKRNLLFRTMAINTKLKQYGKQLRHVV